MVVQNEVKLVRGKNLVTESLAAERTVLANERTFLSFLRTALTLFAAGVTFIRFFGNRPLEIIGWLFIPISIITIILGILRYYSIRWAIKKIAYLGETAPEKA